MTLREAAASSELQSSEDGRRGIQRGSAAVGTGTRRRNMIATSLGSAAARAAQEIRGRRSLVAPLLD